MKGRHRSAAEKRDLYERAKRAARPDRSAADLAEILGVTEDYARRLCRTLALPIRHKPLGRPRAFIRWAKSARREDGSHTFTIRAKTTNVLVVSAGDVAFVVQEGAISPESIDVNTSTGRQRLARLVRELSELLADRILKAPTATDTTTTVAL
jgi:hypothetical protein